VRVEGDTEVVREVSAETYRRETERDADAVDRGSYRGL